MTLTLFAQTVMLSSGGALVLVACAGIKDKWTRRNGR